METNPKLVEELQAGLAAKLNAIAALPAEVNPKLARPGFERGFRAGLLDAKLAAVVVDFATNVALALSGDLAILAEQAGATALRAAIARFKSMPVFFPATIGAGGGFVRLPQPTIAQAVSGLVRGAENIATFDSFVEARAAAKQMAGLGEDTVKYISDIGPMRGQVVGSASRDGLRGWRIDYDPKKGFHVNWWNKTGGVTRSAWIYGANIIKGGTEGDFLHLLQHFQ